MKTEQYPHKIAAIYSSAAHADAAMKTLKEADLADTKLTRIGPRSADPGRGIEPEQAATRNRFIVDMLAGGGIGTAVGAAGAGALALGLPSLFVAAPVVGPLMVAGYGGTLGATVGAIKAFKVKEGLLADMAKDALNRGFHLLIVHSRDADAQERAEKIVAETMAEDMMAV